MTSGDPSTLSRCLLALFGAFLGMLLALAALLFYESEMEMAFVYLSGVVCGILSFFWGEPFVHWLKEAFWHL